MLIKKNLWHAFKVHLKISTLYVRKILWMWNKSVPQNQDIHFLYIRVHTNGDLYSVRSYTHHTCLKIWILEIIYLNLVCIVEDLNRVNNRSICSESSQTVCEVGNCIHTGVKESTIYPCLFVLISWHIQTRWTI